VGIKQLLGAGLMVVFRFPAVLPICIDHGLAAGVIVRWTRPSTIFVHRWRQGRFVIRRWGICGERFFQRHAVLGSL